MSETQKAGVISFYNTHPINEDEILAKVIAQGASLDALTQADLKDFDQDHYGGTDVLDTLADAAEISSEHQVLDVCSGMGGPARWLAYQRGCKVTGLDFTLSRVEAARRLTQRVQLDHLVDFVHGDAAAMPLPSSRYDVLIEQESWLHIPDKAALISECARVLKPGGNIAFTDVVVRSRLDQPTEERLAAEIHTANIASVEIYVALLEENGCIASLLCRTIYPMNGRMFWSSAWKCTARCVIQPLRNSVSHTTENMTMLTVILLAALLPTSSVGVRMVARKAT